jgi:hypothetical protein
MTTRKHLKAHVRARMARTGERYAVARSHVVERAAQPGPEAPQLVNGIRHFPGIHPETTVLRVLSTHAGIRDAAGAVPSEASMLAAGGGLGAGVFAFHYAKESFSSLYLAGRHRWEDPAAFVTGALRRLGLEARVRETGSARAAERDLHEALDDGRPAAAWVDWVELGTRGGRPEESGGAYHVVVVYGIEDGHAVVGDLYADPVRVPLEVLARARARIAKQRHRLITVGPAPEARPALADAAREGLGAGAAALATEPRRNFSLQAIADLADRMTATRGANAWATVFPVGRLRWIGLTSLHRFVETFFTGGGLLRPLGAAALAEIGPDGAEVAERYAALGAQWTALARAALPDEVPLLGEARRLQEQPATDPAAAADVAARLDELARRAAESFPLAEAAAAAQLADLSARLRSIHSAEVAALDALRRLGS